MEHTMKLQPQEYCFMSKGTKRIELRLYDDKRKQIKLGDTIKFLKEPNLEESFHAKVVGLLRYPNFQKLFEDFEISILEDSSMTKQELLTRLEQFYSKQKQEEYEVLGIRVELL